MTQAERAAVAAQGPNVSPERMLAGSAGPAEAQRFLAAIVASSDDAIIGKTLDGVITSWNRGAERIYGYAAGEIIGRPIALLVPPDRSDELPEILERIRRGERIDHYETERVTKSGRRLPISLTVSPIEDERGRVVGASAIARDISERRQAEEQRELLLAELSHRVKNTLAIVQVIAERTGDGAESVTDFLAAFRGRLFALATAHALLTQSEWRGAGVADLARAALEPYIAAADDGRVRLEAADISLKPAVSLTLPLAFHELATNAGKYGALSTPAGRVVVTADVVGPEDGEGGGRELRVEWREEGGPPVTGEPARVGFGTTLLAQAIAHQHQGRTELLWRGEGLVCRLHLPLEEAVGSSRA